MNRLTLEQLQIGALDDVLEIGFGGGALLAEILNSTAGQVIGIDLSAAMMSRARRRFRRTGRLRLVQASVESLPLESASVDKAASVNNLYFWTNPAAALRELARVLRPGGTLAIAFEPPEELRQWPGHRYGFNAYDEAQVRALMEQAGFRRIRRAEGRGRKPDRFLCLTGACAAPEAAS